MKQLSSQRKLFLLGSIVGVVILLTILASVFLYAVYVRRSDSRVVRSIGWSFPIARVGTHVVKYGDFLEARDAIRVYLHSDAAKQTQMAGDLTAAGEQNAYERLVRQAALEDLGEQRKVSVTDEDARASFANLVESSSSTIPNVSQYLQDTFHWTEEQFRQKVIKPAILEDRLAGTFASSTDQGQELDAYLADRLNKSDVKKYLRF